MKIYIESKSLCSIPTGLYRYTSNLCKALRRKGPANELVSVSFEDRDNTPYIPESFDKLFHSNSNGLKKFKRNWFINQTKYINDSRAHSEYDFLSARVRQAKATGSGSKDIKKLKIARELARLNVQLKRTFRKLKNGNGVPFYYEDITGVIHSPYFPFPDDFRTKRPDVITAQTIHDIIPLKFPETFSGNVLKDFASVLESAKRCNLIFTPSEATKRDLLSCHGFENKDIIVTLLAADEVFIPATNAQIQSIRQKFGIPENCQYFLSVSTLEPRKNFPLLLRAFDKLISTATDGKPKLVLTGRIGWDEKTQSEIRRLLDEMHEHVIYTGYISDSELASLYSGALAFLMPSVYEGFGLPLLEAMACGTPVISSNTSSMPEVVGDAGILVSPYHEDEWVSAMLTMLKLNQEDRARLSHSASERSRVFSWDKTAATTLDAYNAIFLKRTNL